MDKPEDIISDKEIEHVHANANFGKMDKREVVSWVSRTSYTSIEYIYHYIREDYNLARIDVFESAIYKSKQQAILAMCERFNYKQGERNGRQNNG